MSTNPPKLTPTLLTPYSVRDVFSEAQCCEITRMGRESTEPEWWNGEDDPKSRLAWSRTISKCDENAWVFDRLEEVCRKVNLHYSFNVSTLSSELLFAKYEVDGHFDWHLDVGEGEIANRKIAIAVLLNAPEEFDGGQWQFLYQDVPVASPKCGAGMIFPAFLPHKVTPVTRGTRYALVGWMIGKPFE